MSNHGDENKKDEEIAATKASTTKLSISLGNKSTKNKQKKTSISLATTAKNKKSAVAHTSAAAFGDEDDDDDDNQHNINTDIPKQPLVIPLLQDSRKSLQEQAKARREQQEQEAGGDHPIKQEEEVPVSVPSNTTISKEDEEAILALKRDAADDANNSQNNTAASKMVIAGGSNTFQRNSKDDETDEQFQNDLEKLPPDLSVKSEVYKAVPISEFGAAMLRGMGWAGDNNNGNDKNKNPIDPTTMPRPSRLGLGATPKMLSAAEDAPATHARRRPKRQDQLQREERLKKQQEEFEAQRQKQVVLDKQQTIQVGSIVYVDDSSESSSSSKRPRAVIRQLQGVPGLNMILVQYEKEYEPTKVKKGSVTLVERSELHDKPFVEGKAPEKEHKQEMTTSKQDDDHHDDDRRDRHDRKKDKEDDRKRSKSDRRKDDDDERDRKRDRDRDRDRGDKKRSRRDGDRSSRDHKKDQKSSHKDDSKKPAPTWIIPNIRVRVVSSKYGDSLYKQKGIVVDVTRKGVATLNMSNGQVVHVAERHLETALPKVGGNACILAGKQRYAKGKLLERDSKKNKGSVQVFEDMSIVTASLDDMAEWCGPLDDDLDEGHF